MNIFSFLKQRAFARRALRECVLLMQGELRELCALQSLIFLANSLEELGVSENARAVEAEIEDISKRLNRFKDDDFIDENLLADIVMLRYRIQRTMNGEAVWALMYLRECITRDAEAQVWFRKAHLRTARALLEKRTHDFQLRAFLRSLACARA